jgi:hypothetical protein
VHFPDHKTVAEFILETAARGRPMKTVYASTGTKNSSTQPKPKTPNPKSTTLTSNNLKHHLQTHTISPLQSASKPQCSPTASPPTPRHPSYLYSKLFISIRHHQRLQSLHFPSASEPPSPSPSPSQPSKTASSPPWLF